MIDEIEIELEEIFEKDLQRKLGQLDNSTNFHWKGENDEYCFFTVAVGSSIRGANKNLGLMTPWISGGLGFQKVKSPFDEALFYKYGEHGYILIAREKNITFSIESNSRKYPNQIIEKLIEVFQLG